MGVILEIIDGREMNDHPFWKDPRFTIGTVEPPDMTGTLVYISYIGTSTFHLNVVHKSAWFMGEGDWEVIFMDPGYIHRVLFRANGVRIRTDGLSTGAFNIKNTRGCFRWGD